MLPESTAGIAHMTDPIQTNSAPGAGTRRWLVPVVVVLGLAGTAALAAWTVTRNRHERALELQRQAERLHASLESRVQSYIDTLPGLRLAAQAGETLTDRQFKDYVEGISLQSRFPALAITFTAQRVTAASRDRFLASVRGDRSIDANGHPGFDIQPPGERAQHLVIRHLQPYDARTFGYDLFDPSRSYRAAAERAIDTGAFTTTAPLLLASNRDSSWDPGLVAVVIRLAVYREGGVPATLDGRRELAQGVVGVSFKARSLIGALLTPELLQIARVRVLDTQAEAVGGPRAGYVFDSDPTEPAARAGTPAPAYSRALQVGDRVWRLEVDPREHVAWAGVDANVAALVAGGAAISLLLGALLRSLMRTNAVATRLAEERTQALRAEQRELQRSERRYRQLFESTFDAVLRTRPDGRVEFANPAACRLFGLSEGDIRLRGRKELADPDDPRCEELLRERARHGRASGVMRMVRGDGSMFEAEVSSILYADDEGKAVATVVVRDVSERQRMEAQLRQTQKLEAIGTLASGIAHDFNNVLTAILANTALLQSEDQEPAGHNCRARLERVTLIRQAAERARSLVGKILMFSRPDVGEPRVLDLRVGVRESVELLRATVPASVSIDVQLPGAPVPCAVEPTQFQQIVLNLCTNAWHALGGRAGAIAIVLDVNRARTPGWSTLTVRDEGSGMDDAVRARIFEPFFTTKPREQGTGLGLAVVHGIVSALRGRIEVESAPGAGTIVTVELPLASGEPGAPAPSSTPPAVYRPAGEDQPVLFLDDDPVVSLSVAALLRHQGFDVTACTDADSAVAALRAAPGRFRALVTDNNMPEMSGIEFVAVARQLEPQMRTVLISGLVTPELERAAHDARIDRVISKEAVVDRLAVELVALVGSDG